MKKNLMMLLSIFALFLTLQSCKTLEYRLPADIEQPVLGEDFRLNEIELTISWLRWKLRANDVRYIVGEISKEERDDVRNSILELITKLEYNKD